jgi:MFS family permease
MLMLGNFALGIAGAFAVHLPGFLSQLGAGEAVIGRIISLQALTALLLAPVAGRTMDHHGRRPVIRVGLLLLLAGSAGYLTLHAIGPRLYAVRILEGAGATLLYAAMFTSAADLVPPVRRTEGLALFGASGLLAMGISPALGDLILVGSDYRALFACATAFCAIGLVMCWSLPDAARAAHEPGHATGLLRIAMQRDLWPVWAAALAFFACMSALLAFMKTFVLHAGTGGVGSFFATYAVCALALRVIFGSLPDRVGPRRMVLPALGSYALGIALLSWSSAPPSLLLAGVLCGAGHGYAFPVLLSLVISRAHASARGTATAIFTTVDWAGNLLSPPLLGWLIERTGYSHSFATLSAVALLGAGAFYALDWPP